MLKKGLLSLIIFQSLLVSTSQAAQCDFHTPPVIKYWKKGKVVERIYGRFDSTQRKWWADTGMTALAFVIPIGTIVSSIFWFGENRQAAGYDAKHLDADSKIDAEKYFTQLQWACHSSILDTYKKSVIYKHNGVYVSDKFYCSRPGINGVYGAYPTDNDGNGNQYFIDIKRGVPVFDYKATKLKKCQKINACINNSGDSIEIEDLFEVAKKIKCPKGSIQS